MAHADHDGTATVLLVGGSEMRLMVVDGLCLSVHPCPSSPSPKMDEDEDEDEDDDDDDDDDDDS